MTDKELEDYLIEKETVFYLSANKGSIDCVLSGKVNEIIALLAMGISEYIKGVKVEPEKFSKMLNKAVERAMEDG